MPSPPIADQHERQCRFEAVYAAHRGPILGYVLRRTENGDDAADVIAETFMTAWRRLDDMPPEPQARLWLYGEPGRAARTGSSARVRFTAALRRRSA